MIFDKILENGMKPGKKGRPKTFCFLSSRWNNVAPSALLEETQREVLFWEIAERVGILFK